MEITEIGFHQITMKDKAWIDRKYAEDDRDACEYTFANNFVWRKIYHATVAEWKGCLLIRFWQNGEAIFSYPIGNGDKRAVIEDLLHICQKDGTTLKMQPLSKRDREQLFSWFPGQFLVKANRDAFDYIYSKEKLFTLAGKKLHGKRNHIARFKDGGDWSYEPMDEKNLEECRTMTYTWMHMRSEKWNEEMEEEVAVLHEAFDHMWELGLTGGVLRREGQIVAFSIGEPLNSETYVVHFEKAYPDMQGAYPMINQQFVEHACEGFRYVNREDDTGDAGLRKAKLSYYPEILLEKYTAEKSRVVYADRERDAEQIAKIWKTCFGDEEKYISCYQKKRMTDENMLVIWEDQKIVSMASFLPVKYHCDGEVLSARYVYAVATLPEYRGRGLAAEILNFAKARYGEPLILAPAEEGLVSWYEKLGFVQAFSDDRKEDDMEQPGRREFHGKWQSVESETYTRIRDAVFCRDGYVQWEKDAVAFAIEWARLSGGDALLVWTDDEKCAEKKADISGETVTSDRAGILLYAREKDTLEILETTLSPDGLRSFLPELYQRTGTSRFLYQQRRGMLWMPEKYSNRKIPGDGYLNLTLA